MNDIVARLSRVERGDHVHVTLANGRTISGDAKPVAYTPNDRLRLELESDDPECRFALTTTYESTEWTTTEVQRFDGDETEWTYLGTAESILVEYGAGDADNRGTGKDTQG